MKGARRNLSLAEVAVLMNIEHPDPAYRRQFVWRLLRRLEKRDGTAYMRRLGPGKGKLVVSPRALEQLAPYSPAAVTKLAEDVAQTKQEVLVIRRQVNAHGAKIRELEKARAGLEGYMRHMASE